MVKRTIIFWIFNEIIQIINYKYEILDDFYLIEFLNTHLSSLFGGIVICGLFFKYNKKKIAFIIPIFQIFYDLLLKQRVDYFDLIFISIGVILYASEDYLKTHNNKFKVSE